MNIKDITREYDKYEIYKKYIRITNNYVNYESITKQKLVNNLLDYYSDYNNIIDICTLRELEYLEKIIEDSEDLLDEKYYFERTNLIDKLIIYELEDNVVIINELFDGVIEALGNINYKEITNRDRNNESLIGSLKAFGYDYVDIIKDFVVDNVMDEDIFYKIIDEDRIFNYYIKTVRDGNDEKILIPYDYLEYFDMINAKMNEYPKDVNLPLNAEKFRYLFYDVFDRNDDRVKKVLSKISEKYNYQYYEVIEMIEKNIIIGEKDDILNNLRDNYFPNSYLKLLEDIINDIPLPILNGYTFNQYNNINSKKKDVKINHEKQVNALLTVRDKGEFMKCYTALLEFTNKEYKINNSLKLYNSNFGTDEAEDIAKKFWENKEYIINKFCEKNSFNFSEYELNKVKQFNNGFNAKFLLYKFDRDYCEFIFDNKIYMVKGFNCNIDRLIPSSDLPCFINSNIIDFNGKIVCDNFFMQGDVKTDINKILDNVKNMKKYYRL